MPPSKLAEVSHTMAEHQVVALNANFNDWTRDRAVGLQGIQPFLYYSVEQITKQYNLLDDDVQYGITDDPNDGGIDAFYCLAGKKNTLIRDDIDRKIVGVDSIRIMVFQVKSSLSETGFKPGDIDLFTHFADALLTLTDIDLTGQYTPRILTRIQTFKDKLLEAAGDFPSLRLEFYYVTRGDEEELNLATIAARDRLQAVIEKHRGTSAKEDFEFFPVDTGKLLAYVRKRRQRTRLLKWSQASLPVEDGYVGLMRLTDYFEFLKDEKGELDELIFESNVRGSQGNTSVNKKIRATLDATPDSKPDTANDEQSLPDFWRLNNGITITCSAIKPVDAFNLEVQDAQVVNGLQTSREVFAHFSDPKFVSNDSRRIMIKLLPVTDDAIRDTIIRATNNQNPLRASALRATDERQRDIEDLFKEYGLFYDRRPGFYKEQRKPIRSIVTLNDIVQAMLALVLHRPDDARGRPGDYVKEGKQGDAKYRLIFGTARSRYPLGLYVKTVRIIRTTEDFLAGQDHLSSGDKHNLLYYVAFYAVCELARNATPSADEVLAISSEMITKAHLERSLEAVDEVYFNLSAAEDNPDVVAKGTELLETLNAKLLDVHGSRPPETRPPSRRPKKIRDVLRDAEVK
jgi:AIPR protein